MFILSYKFEKLSENTINHTKAIVVENSDIPLLFPFFINSRYNLNNFEAGTSNCKITLKREKFEISFALICFQPATKMQSRKMELVRYKKIKEFCSTSFFILE